MDKITINMKKIRTVSDINFKLINDIKNDNYYFVDNIDNLHTRLITKEEYDKYSEIIAKLKLLSKEDQK